MNEFDANFWGTYDRNSSEFENVMTWGQHLVECSVYYKQAPSRPLSQVLSPPHLPPPSGAGEMEKKRDHGKEFASEISIELPLFGVFTGRVKLNKCVVRIEDCEDHAVIGCADGSEYKVGNAFHCEQLVVGNYGVMKENIRNYIVFRRDGFSMHHNRQNARLRSSEKARGPRFFQ